VQLVQHMDTVNMGKDGGIERDEAGSGPKRGARTHQQQLLGAKACTLPKVWGQVLAIDASPVIWDLPGVYTQKQRILNGPSGHVRLESHFGVQMAQIGW